MDKNFEIRNLLKNLGIMPNYKGYSYITQGVEIVLEEFKQGKTFKQRIGTCDLYALIAELNNDTPTRVERAIRYAVDVAYRQGMNKMNELFPNMKWKPRNTTFILTLAEYVLFLRGGEGK